MSPAIHLAALFVATDGCYFGLPNVDPWDEARDARRYAGPHPVIAHPPCQRWGRYWHGSPRKPHQYKLGDDGGAFASALVSVRAWGGVLEHPAHSNAWKAFGLERPHSAGGWHQTGDGWTCHVEQGHYGHMARKATWLYYVGPRPAPLIWGSSGQRLPQIALDRYGYEKARRTGVMAYVGGKDKSKIRAATPIVFRDLLISMVSSPAASCPRHLAGGEADASGPFSSPSVSKAPEPRAPSTTSPCPPWAPAPPFRQ